MMVRRRQRSRHGRSGPAGFTLVELMVAMLILAIGIMATMAMQYSSLAGSMLSRDNSSASDVGQRVIELMGAEAQQWRSGASNVGLGSVNSTHSGRATLLQDTFQVNWQWVRVFDDPVDSRLNTATGARFCVYTRGGDLQLINLGQLGQPGGPGLSSSESLAIVHVAVVFPSANQVFENNACPAANSIGSDLDSEIAPTPSTPDTSRALQLAGYRVQFFGTQIARRDYLEPI